MRQKRHLQYLIQGVLATGDYMVVLQALTSAIFGMGIDKVIKKIDETKPKDIQVVNVKQNPNTYTITEIARVSTTNKKWSTQDHPLLTFENALKKDSIIKSISIIPDEAFRIGGKLLITVDDVPVFRSRTIDSFKDIQASNIEINKSVSQDSEVKVFLTSFDGVLVSVTIQVTFGE